MADRSESSKKLIRVLFLLLGVVTVLVALSCSPKEYPGPVETVTISEGYNETRTLIYVAEERGYFAANGIALVYKEYAPGPAAVNALLKDEVDLALGSDFVLVGNVLKGADIRAIASIDRFENTYIIGRADRGIRDIADLKGKKIGITRGTSPEFYLGRFLELNGMSIRQVTLVEGNPAQLMEAVTSGSVDAVAIFQPEASTIRRNQGDNAVVWSAQSSRLTFFNVFGAASWVNSHAEVITRLLKSLSQAEEYLIRNPAEVKTMIQKRLKYDDAYMNAVWTEHQFSLSLDKSLLVAMEDEARWMIQNNLTTEKTVPDFMNYIYVDALKKIKPEVVNIIR